MSAAPRISVILPIYNGTDTIDRALRSVFAQTFEDYEIIVVDDASTDALDAALARNTDRPIRLLRHETNKGAGAARNTGIVAARGDYVALIDCDDEWLPEYLARQYATLETSPPEVAASLVDFYLERDHLGRRETKRLDIGQDWFLRLLAGCNVNAGSGLMVRRSVYETVGYYDATLTRFEDWDWLLRCAAIHPLTHVPELLAIYHSGDSWPAPTTIDEVGARLWHNFEGPAKARSPAARQLLRSTLYYERAAALYHARRFLPAFVAIVQTVRIYPGRGAGFYWHILRRTKDSFLERFFRPRIPRRSAQRSTHESQHERIKIVHLINGLEVGGAETMLVKLVLGMDRRRFDNHVITLTARGKLVRELAERGISVESLDMRRGRFSPLSVIRLVRMLRRASILHTWLYHSDLIGLLAGSVARTPAILWNLRCSDMDMSRYPLLTRLTLRLLVRLSPTPRLVIANSQSARTVHQRMGYRPKAWRVISNGFDVDLFRPDLAARHAVRQELDVGEESILIGLPARYDPMKDHATFFAAAEIIATWAPQVRFVGIGKGVDEGNPEIGELIRSHGLAGKTILLGERRDMPRLFNALDIVTLASAFGEGFPNVLGEAMASGTACVSTAVGDAALIVGDAGRIVPPRDPQALAIAWRELIDCGADGRRAIGVAARQRIIENYSLDAVIEQYESLFGNIADDVRTQAAPNSTNAQD